ncbi:MAG: hypothetical protein ACLPN6_15330 [Streptosporangiaceae bacterium]|jgi:hypothetical protein
MNATFFGLAFLAALNPKLLGVDLLLTAGAEPRFRSLPRQEPGGTLKGHEWAQRILSKPRYALVVLIGAVRGTPGGEYLAAPHVLIPVVLLLVRPEDTRAGIKRSQDWLMSHARELIAVVLLLVGACRAVNGLARLL